MQFVKLSMFQLISFLKKLFSKPTGTIIGKSDQLQSRIGDSPVLYKCSSGALPDRSLEVLLGEFPTDYQYPLTSHKGEEFGYLLSGILLLRIEDDTYQLFPCDSHHILTGVPHTYSTTESEGATVLWALNERLLDWHEMMKR